MREKKGVKSMTLDILNKVIKENNIPKDVHLLSDSGWECDPTEMDGIFYHRGSNTIVFTQRGTNSKYEQSDEWEILYDPELKKLEGLEVYPVTTSRDYDVTEAFKKAIKKAGDFENYYGIHEKDIKPYLQIHRD